MQRNTLVVLAALIALPQMVEKGDTEAVTAITARLNDKGSFYVSLAAVHALSQFAEQSLGQQFD